MVLFLTSVLTLLPGFHSFRCYVGSPWLSWFCFWPLSTHCCLASYSYLRCCGGNLMVKGTQDWEFFWLRFWNLRYFFVSYVKIFIFYKKIFLIGPLLGEVRFFCVVLGLRGMKKNFELGQKFFFFFSVMDPKYDQILVFGKFIQLIAPGTTLCVDLGSKCQILFPLVWD